jgi:hypothetical protein
MHMIRDATDTIDLRSIVAPDGGKIRVKAWTKVPINRRLAVLGAEDDVNDDVAVGLWHGEMKRAFSAWVSVAGNPGALPQALMKLRRWRC